LPPNPLTNTQQPMPPTATRNSAVPMANKKKENSSIAGLLTPTARPPLPGPRLARPALIPVIGVTFFIGCADLTAFVLVT
ncbi:unnamed protein product, partial [Rotaria sp. Silwood2]